MIPFSLLFYVSRAHPAPARPPGPGGAAAGWAGHLFFEVERNPKAFIRRVQITAKSSPLSDPHLGNSNPASPASPVSFCFLVVSVFLSSVDLRVQARLTPAGNKTAAPFNQEVHDLINYYYFTLSPLFLHGEHTVQSPRCWLPGLD